MRASVAPTATTTGSEAGKSTTALPELPAAATRRMPPAAAFSAAVFTAWLKLSAPRLMLMTFTGFWPLSA